MNKKSILLILLSTLALGANAQGKYTIKSNLQNAEGNHGKTKSARIQKRNVFSTDKNEM